MNEKYNIILTKIKYFANLYNSIVSNGNDSILLDNYINTSYYFIFSNFITIDFNLIFDSKIFFIQSRHTKLHFDMDNDNFDEIIENFILSCISISKKCIELYDFCAMHFNIETDKKIVKISDSFIKNNNLLNNIFIIIYDIIILKNNKKIYKTYLNKNKIYLESFDNTRKIYDDFSFFIGDVKLNNVKKISNQTAKSSKFCECSIF